ncbi:hypothetical protein SEA_TYPHA_2 [Mycobacterium phage Typha]|uniref:Uncharacterized protein n=1 Tax=Mycobacterium phage Typha TaxID=2517971 RepID=A0A482JBS0_9CAUD|nr:hypothetical protein KCH40_gp002 [Mycobacterium phage Typha]QBP29659.1 hypothetical protein SEA_TYPHA_2 [Mycobacterium phage Typha]URM86446.1 hypothetical protein PBI_HILLTOPFARM_2 [Mycobacterium phage Hilltopfarm]
MTYTRAELMAQARRHGHGFRSGAVVAGSFAAAVILVAAVIVVSVL